ncbi:MAG: DNA/RNA non-specific endonuclease [Bacteroidales bacterium]|nr:DNA/RNA non-specific endonuclease [Bacteroidales bacterium]
MRTIPHIALCLALGALLGTACSSPSVEEPSREPDRPTEHSADPSGDGPSVSPDPSKEPSAEPVADHAYDDAIKAFDNELYILQGIVEAYERDIPVTGVTGEEESWTLELSGSRYILICDFNEQGVPSLGATRGDDGFFYWTAEGKIISDEALVSLGKPALRVSGGQWQVSYGQDDWTSILAAAPADDIYAIRLFNSVTDSDSSVKIGFADGTSIRLAKNGVEDYSGDPSGDGSLDPAELSVTVTTAGASNFTTSSALLSASFSGATATVREAGFEWGTSQGNLDEVLQSQTVPTGTRGTFSEVLSGLGDGRTYWYRAYVMLQRGDEIKTFYGSVRSFTTTAEVKPGEGNQAGWFELPVMNVAKSGSYMYNAKDDTQYYAYHMCAGGEKGPSGRTARNYTVCFSTKYHCPLWVAAPLHNMYRSTGRHESYRKDPDIPSDPQWSSKTNASGFNKGHVLGSADRNISVATNQQVFYYTNIAPQLSEGFNTGGGGWNTLEDYVDGLYCSDTLYTVIGCYFDRYTDGYGYTASPRTLSGWGRSDVAMPTMFYYVLLRTKSGRSGKSVTSCSASELQCAAFVRAHTNDLKGQKVTSREMMSVADLEKITGVTYFPNVPNAPKNTYSPSDWGL